MAGTPIDPSYQFGAITPSDTAILKYNGLPVKTKAIYIGGAGDLAVKNEMGTTVTFQNLPAASMIPIAVSQVLAATSCTLIIGLY
jgi:hypothetical protein